MDIEAIKYDFSICRLKDFSLADFTDEFFFACKTDEEYSLVCISENAPENVIERDDGWRAFRIRGVLDFSLVGILSKISALLADAGVGIFAVSTFNTDYILTKSENFEKALTILENAGYTIA